MPKTAPVYSTEKSAQLGEILKKMAANPKGLLLRDVVQANKSKNPVGARGGLLLRRYHHRF